MDKRKNFLGKMRDFYKKNDGYIISIILFLFMIIGAITGIMLAITATTSNIFLKILYVIIGFFIGGSAFAALGILVALGIDKALLKES